MKELIAQAKQGDRFAMTEIYNRTYKELFYYCTRLCGNESDAQDLVQDTYLTAFEKLCQYKRDDNFKGWLHTIALHKYYNKIRDERPQLWVDEPLAIPIEEELSCPEKYAEDRELHRMLMDIITNKLAAPQRITVIMYYYDDRSVQEIAEELQCAEGTVKSRLYYSRRIIREELENKGYTLGGGIYLIAFAFSSHSARFIAGAAVNSAVLGKILTADSAARRAAVRSVKTFAKKKLIVGAITAAAVGGAAAAKGILLNNNEKNNKPSEIGSEIITEATTPNTSFSEINVTETLTGENSGDPIPGSNPIEYTFLNGSFKVMIPESYDPETADKNEKRSDSIKKNHEIYDVRRISVKFFPDRSSDDIVIAKGSITVNDFEDPAVELSKYFTDVSVDSRSELSFPVENYGEPDVPSDIPSNILASRYEFTAKSKKERDIKGTIIRFEWRNSAYIFIFSDQSGIRGDEYEDIISSIVFEYVYMGWRR